MDREELLQSCLVVCEPLSASTQSSYLREWRILFKHFRIDSLNDLLSLTNDKIQSYFDRFLIKEKSLGTYRRKQSALRKLNCLRLQKHEHIEDWEKTISKNGSNAKSRFRPRTIRSSPGFEDPQTMIDSLFDKDQKDFALIAWLQYQTGFRISQISKVFPEQYLGRVDAPDMIAIPGTINVNGNEFILSGNYLLSEFEKRMGQGGIQIDVSAYIRAIKRTAKLLGEANTGTDHFRYNFAQEMYDLFCEDHHPSLVIKRLSEIMGVSQKTVEKYCDLGDQ